jgi:anti-repressor protein
MHPIGGQEVQATKLRELWEKLESGPHYSDWIKKRNSQYRFIEGKDYVAVQGPLINPRNPTLGYKIDHYGTISMSKELAMVENNHKGRMIRRYFIVPPTPPDLAT